MKGRRLIAVWAVLFAALVGVQGKVSALEDSVENAVRRGPSNPAPVPASPQPSLGWTLVNLVVGLAIVLLLIWIGSKWVRKRWQGAAGNAEVRVLGAVPLAPGKFVHVVEVAGRVWVLGVGQDVRVIEVIDDEERLSRFRRDAAPAPSKFEQRLGEAIREMAGRRREWLRRQRGRDG